MDNLIRCPACRGTKKVARLGGVIGDCLTCDSTGKIKAVDKPIPVVVQQAELVNDIIEATTRVKPVRTTVETIEPVVTAKDIINAVANIPETENPVMTVTKRKVFKRKKT